jgi:hypothetical protein
MDFFQAGVRQEGDEAEAGGGGEGLEGILSFHMSGLGMRQKEDIIEHHKNGFLSGWCETRRG